MSKLESYYGAPLSIAVIGGGTGNSTTLGGLKPFVGEGLAAVVNTFDDGGGTGKIRVEYGGIAVGDLRQCARALSDLSPDALAVLEGRFEPGTGLSDMNVHEQNVGNLMLEQAHQKLKGDPERIIAAYSDIYRIQGQVLPVSNDSRRLRITTTDGRVIEGEHEAEGTMIPSLKDAKIGFDEEAVIGEHAEAVISSADLVVLAPGDLYTSIGPNLVVRGMREAIRKATAVVMVANLMNRNRHTVGYDALDYAQEYDRLIGDHLIDRVLYNTTELDAEDLETQAREFGSHPVQPNHEGLKKAGYRPLGKDLLSHEQVTFDQHDALASTRSAIRHDPRKVAHALMGVYFGNGFNREEP